MAPPEGQVVRWWDAAALMTRDAVTSLLKPLMDRQRITIGARQIELMRDRAFDEQARKALPGQDRIGQQLYEDAIKAGEKAHAAALQTLGTPKGDTPKDLEAAVLELEKYRDALPVPGDERTDEAAELLKKHRAAVEKRASELRESALSFLEKDRAADRVTLHKLIQMLWEPKRGALDRFRWIPDDEVRRQVDSLKDPAYRRRGAEELRNFEAFTKLFAGLKMAFETKTWVDLNLEGPDGKPQKVTEVTAEGLTCPARTPKLWVDLTAPYLLTKVFYVKPDQPRYPLTPDNLRGLAVLAELAGDEAQATAHWQKYQAALPAEQADLKAGVALHLAEPRSMQAARLWNEMNVHLAAIEAFGAKEQLPQGEKGASISPAQRDAIRREKAAILDHWREAGQIHGELHMNAELASTRWGAAIRAETHPRAAFTGESIPASVPMPAPLPISPPPPPAPAPPRSPATASRPATTASSPATKTSRTRGVDAGARRPGPDGDVRVRLKVVPGGSRDEVLGPLGDRIKVKVSAPPEGGRANRAVMALLAELLGVSPHALRLVSGETQPLKLVAVRGRTVADVAAALGLAAPE